MLCHKNHFWLPDDHAELDFTGEVFTFSQILVYWVGALLVSI